jgi:fibronectin type 3 domain-containing protein
MNGQKSTFLFLIIVFTYLGKINAWWSEPGVDTHERLSTDIILNMPSITQQEYTCPDLYMDRFGNIIIDATEGAGDDAAAHGGNATINTGDAQAFWALAMSQYKSNNFAGRDGAYFNLGQILHLVEDMAVPAHALDIPHAFNLSVVNPSFKFDDLETNAGNIYYTSSIVPLIPISNFLRNTPWCFYGVQMLETKRKIDQNEGAPPGRLWSDYWRWNNYGPNGDIFPNPFNPLDVQLPEETDFIMGQLKQARDYGATFLIAASKKLPPLISNFKINNISTNPDIIPCGSNTISFKVLENRTPNVKIFMAIDKQFQQPIENTSFGAGIGYIQHLDSRNELPYGIDAAIDWNGKLANGNNLCDNAPYTLYVYVQDEDGNNSDTLSMVMNTELFSVTSSPPQLQIQQGQSGTHTITISNKTSSTPLNFNIDIAYSGNGWSVNPTSFSNVLVSGSGIESRNYTVTNNSATSDLLTTISVTETSCNITKHPQNLNNPGSPGHNYDHPDDNQSITNSQYPTPWLYDSKSPIGVLSSGWGEGINFLLGKFNVATTVVKPDLTILNEPGKSINDLDVLCIGSAGLDGLESSPIFRKKLSDFVDQGGVLIDLTAKNGYEFAALPGGEVTGYGWNEDQSCLSAAVSMVKYHQMLSSQTSTDLAVNVDGYFTKWPLSATILLQRNKNGMPALLTYPFGKGTVIATTIFEDWAYGNNQSTEAGQNLIRDMVAWARIAKTLPEFAIGADVGFPFNVDNSTSVEAQKVVITTLDPNRTSVKRDTITLTIPANDTVSVPYSFGSAPNNPGIWYVQYSLLNNSNTSVQQEQLGQMFVISNPAGVAKTPAITFSVNSDDENYANGSTGVFNIHVWNHTDTAKIVQVYYWFPHNLWATNNSNVYGTCSWSEHSSNLHESFNVPAKGEQTITVSVPLVSYDRLWAEFWDENFNYIGEGSRGFYVYTPSCQISATTDKSEYKAGDTVSASLKLTNTGNMPFSGSLNVKVLSPVNTKVWENTVSVNLPPDVLSTHDVSFELPTGSISGAYSVCIEVNNNGKRVGSYTTHFIIPEAFLALTPNIPGVLHDGNNAISFGIENYGLVAVAAGTIEARLLNPTGQVVWNGTTGFNLEGGLTTTVNFNVPVTSLEFGKYRLAYRAQYNGINSKEAQKDILSTCLINTSTDKSSYKIRESMSLDVSISDNGRFQYGNMNCVVSLPVAGDQTSTITLNPGQNIHIPISLHLPESMIAGTQTGMITLTLPSGSSTSKTFSVLIPPAKIIITLDTADFKAGDFVAISAVNTGGVDATGVCSFEIRDARDIAVIKKDQYLDLKAGGISKFNITIPDNVVNGNYELIAKVYNQTSNDTTVFIKPLSISGLLATLDLRTDKQIYSEAESKTALADLTIDNGVITNGKMSFSAFKILSKSKTFTSSDWDTITTTGANDENVALGQDPSESDHGWGGGALPQDIVDGITCYDSWAHGLAFTGGTGSWMGEPCGWRQATVRFSKKQQINRVRVWHLGDEHIPKQWSVKFWNDTSWQDVVQKSHIIRSDLKSSGPGYCSTPSEDIFEPVTTSKVRFLVNNCDITHGWIYEFEAFKPSMPTLHTIFDAGKQVEWKTISWKGTVPAGTTVKTATRSANSLNELNTASWSPYCDTSGSMITSLPGKFLEIQSVFTSPDPNNLLPVIDSILINYNERTQVWQNEQQIQLANESMSFSSNIFPLQGTGRFELEGQVLNSLGQEVIKNLTSFYIDKGPLFLTFETDKLTYQPGETVTVTGEAINDSTDAISNIVLNFTVNGNQSYSETFNIAGKTNHHFSFSFTAPQTLSILTGTLNQLEISEQIPIETPKIDVQVVCADIAGRAPFPFIVRIHNPCIVDANMVLSIGDDIHNVTLKSKQTQTIEEVFTISKDSTIDVEISGDISESLQKNISFGEAVDVTLSPQNIYSEGVVSIPYTVQNTGLLTSNVDLSFTQNGQIVNKSFVIPVGKIISDELTFNLVPGYYDLSYSSVFGQGSVSYRVAKSDQIAMQLDVNRYSAPKVLILRDYYSEDYLRPILEAAGMNVTISDDVASSWNGTNPSAKDFDVIIFSGNDYYNNMSTEAQNSIVAFVNNGGGLLTSEWITYGRNYYNNFSEMDSLLLYEPSQWNYNYGDQTFTKIGNHPITMDLPATFYVNYYHSGNIGGIKDGATSILSGNWLPNAVAVKQYGKGRIVQFAIDGYSFVDMCQTDSAIKKLFINSVNWAAKSTEGNTIRANITLSNEGCNGFEGQLSSSTRFFAKTENLSLSSGETKTIKYDLDIASVEPGTYTLKSSVLNGGKVLQQASKAFVVGAPELELVTMPTGNNFTPGQQITLNFSIKNKGMVEGKADIGLKLVELYDGTRTSWVAPGMEKQESFTLQIPDDYPDGEYKAEFKLNDTIVEIPFTVSGVKCTVAATLDKPIYQIGETATLTLDITNESALTPAVYAKASSNGDEDREDFTLSAHQLIQLHIPVNERTLNRVAYGIYMVSGRAIYLNTIYIRIVKGVITLYTDKSVYNTGDTVTVNVVTSETDNLSVTTTTGYMNTIAVTGPTSFTFVLPDAMASGTQAINYQFGENTGLCNFDILGYSLKVLNVTLNKQTYNPIDQLSADMTVKSNKAISVVAKGWLYSPTGTYTDLFEVTRDLLEGETAINVSAPIIATVAGTHKLVYGIYSSGTNLALVTGSKAFDVKPAAIIAVTTNKSMYSDIEEVNTTVQTYSCGEYTGTVEILNGNAVVASKPVLLNNATDVTLQIGLLPPGIYKFTARLKNESEIASEKAFEVTIVDITAPSVPTGLILAMDGGVANLQWNANTEPDITGYNIYKNGEKLNIIPSKSSSFRNEELVPGITYTYHVTAVDKSVNESAPSASVVARIDNTAPVITMTPQSDIVSITPVTLTYSVVDDYDQKPTIQAVYPSPTIFTVPGAYPVSIIATDNQGNRSEKAISIVIDANGNRPPAIVNLNDTTINEGDTLRLVLQAQDPDGDPLIFSAANLPGGAQVDAETGIFLWIAGYNQTGSYTNVKMIVSDNGTPMLKDTATFSITVNNINRAPVLDAIGNKAVNEGELLSFSISASDSDGDNLTYSTGNLPAGATFEQNTHVFTWRPNYEQEGNYQNVVFTVTDDGQPRMSDQEGITITVGHVNLPPVLDAVGDKLVNEGDTLKFKITAFDPDGNSLTYSAGNLPTGATFDESTQQFFWVPEFGRDGIYPDVLFIVTDNGQPAASDQEVISIAVGHVNRPPVLAMIGNKSVLEGDSLKFAITATDPDNDTLVYSAGNLPEGAVFNSVTQNFRWVPRFDQAGNYSDVIFSVTDKGHPQASDQEAITISVGDINQPPVLAQIGDKIAKEGDTLKFPIIATDPDGNPILFSAGNLPTGAKFNPSTQNFEWIISFGQAGTYPDIWFEATDDGFPQASDRETITITVGKVNRAPVMDLIGDKSITEGDNLSFSVIATDPDGDNVFLSATNLPTGASFNPANGVFAWVPSAGQASVYPDIVFTASDSDLAVTRSISITVRTVLLPPIGLAVSAKSGKVGLSWNSVVNADHYNIYRQDKGNVPLASSIYTSYIDNAVINGTTYKYTVTALDANGRESGHSVVVNATPIVRSR